MDGVCRGDFALQARRNLRQICFARIFQVGPLLQVARILGGLAIDQPRMRRGNNVGQWDALATNPRSRSFIGPVYLSNSATCAGDSRSLIERERLVIRQERAGAGDIRLRLLVGAAMNGVVRTLEEKGFAIEHQLDAGIAEFRIQAAEAFARAARRKR